MSARWWRPACARSSSSTKEVAQIERAIARQALASEDIRRLMTIPGVDLVTAAAVMAAIGDVRRFQSARKLVGCLGLDPKVSQSGSQPARHGRISKQGSPQARHALGEAAWVALRTPSAAASRAGPPGERTSGRPCSRPSLPTADSSKTGGRRARSGVRARHRDAHLQAV